MHWRQLQFAGVCLHGVDFVWCSVNGWTWGPQFSGVLVFPASCIDIWLPALASCIPNLCRPSSHTFCLHTIFEVAFFSIYVGVLKKESFG